MSKPLVSIIIPVYNAGQYVAQSIQSALDQTWPDKEIIIVDDGSTDNSLEVCKRFESDSVKVISQENRGASTARNIGLKEAKGSYIQFLDADDLLSYDKIEGQINCLNGSMTHLGICKSTHFNDGADHLKAPFSQDWYYKDSNDPVDFLIKLYAGDEVLPGYGGMVQPNAWLTPRNLIEKAGLWNEFIGTDDDGEFFCRVILASEGIKYSDAGINYYRKYTARYSLSAQNSRAAYENSISAIDLKFSYLKATAADPIVDRIFARHYWWTGVSAYPQFKDLSKKCVKKAIQLGYGGETYVGGPGGHKLAAVFGWKAARFMAYHYYR